MQIIQGPGPLGRDIDYSELTAALKKKIATVMISTQAQVTITGDGTAKTIYSKTWAATDWANTDTMEIIVAIRDVRTAGAGSRTYVFKNGSSTIATSSTFSGSPEDHLFEVAAKEVSAANNQAWVKALQFDASTQTILNIGTQWSGSSHGSAFSTTITTSPAAGTNLTIDYSITIIKYPGGNT